MDQTVNLTISETKSNVCPKTKGSSSTDKTSFPLHSDNNDNNSKVLTEKPVLQIEISKDPFSNNYIWKQTPYISNETDMPSLDCSSSNYTISHSLVPCADVPSLNSQLPKSKVKIRKNVYFSNVQFLALEKTFQLDKYPSRLKRILLAHKLGLTENNVNSWFMNRRTKAKKENSTEKTVHTCKIHTDVRHNVSPNESAQVSNKTNINKKETKELHKSVSSIAGRLLEDSAKPRVNPFHAPITTSTAPVPKLPEWYPGLYPLAYPTFNHFTPNSWSAGYYGHGFYRPSDYRYYDMGLPVQYPPFDYRNLLY